MNRTTFIIQTFTMASDFDEDRIRIHAVDEQGGFQAIFITRRLADRFVPLLVTHAEAQVEAAIPADLALSFEQERLRIDRDDNPQPDVQPLPDAAPWLCRTIHLTAHPDGLQWTLTDDAAIDAHMVLDEEAVRAVLDVLLITYRTLEWSEQAFPEWVSARGQVPVVAPGSLN